MKMCQAFAKAGHDVQLVALAKKDDLEPDVDDIFSFYGTSECFTIVRLPWLSIKGQRFLYGYHAARRARHFGADIVYCRHLVASAMAARMGLGTIFESHKPVKHADSYFDKLFRTKPWKSDIKKIVVITNALKHYYEEEYPEIGQKIIVAPDGADPFPDDITPVYLSDTPDRLKVGYIGHLYKGKGMELISSLAPRIPWADFHIVGGLDDDLSYWKGKCRHRENIVFHGYVPHKETCQYIKAFDIALLPNQKMVAMHGDKYKDIAQWTSPLKAFEYMAGQKPIISSDLPVLKEIFTHEVNALLCPPDDEDAWADSLFRLRNERVLRNSLANNAYLKFINNYTWEKRAKTLLSALLDD
jgi:glycosyltransferase involved in cell wall biosynthesis